MNGIEIRICTVNNEKRLENVRKLQQKLGIPDENVFIDYERKGPLTNFNRAFSKPTDKTHILLLEDDVDVCNHFIEIATKIANARPDAIIALFDYYGIMEFKTPYIKSKNRLLTTPGTIVPVKYVPLITSFKEDPFFNIQAGDSHISFVAQHYGLDILMVVPNIVNVLPLESTLGHSQVYSKSFRYDVRDVDWDSEITEEVYCH